VAGYLYTYVTLAKAQESTVFGTTWSTNAWHLLEKFFVAREIPADKKDLANGDRAYRMHTNFKLRLDLKRVNESQVMVEKRFAPTTLGDFVFNEIDPTTGKLAKHTVWLPVGP
jgi:hypothetical protein